MKKASWTTRPASKNTNSFDDKTDTAFSANENKDKTCHYYNKMGHIAPECRKKQRDKAVGITTSKTSKGANLNPKVKAMAARERINLMTGNPKVPIGVTTAKFRPTPSITAVPSLRLMMQTPMVREKRDQHPIQRVRANLWQELRMVK